MKKRLAAGSIVIAIALVLGGCSIGGGSTTRIIEPTLGQELIDLEKAYDRGVINSEEYNRLKHRLKSSAKHHSAK